MAASGTPGFIGGGSASREGPASAPAPEGTARRDPVNADLSQRRDAHPRLGHHQSASHGLPSLRSRVT